MTGSEISEWLQQHAQMAEVAQCIFTFEGWRGASKVTVEIFDRGPAAGDLRYYAIATRDDGTSATGNPAATVRLVLDTLHWADLDRT